jgi:dimeric dUTPase (all-alpha-NTP-PPase superfamily)
MSEKNPENKCVQLMIEAAKISYDKDALNIMMNMQYDLQMFYAKKRGSITPDHENKERIKEALYHFNCFVAEIWELEERIHMGKPCEGDMIEIKFEVIDAWHFFMNMFLYLGIRKFDENLEFFWNYVGSNYDSSLICIVKRWGTILDELPYKYWKTYDNYDFNMKRVEKIAEDMLCAFIQLAKYFEIRKEEFYSYYIAKNKENHERQHRGY